MSDEPEDPPDESPPMPVGAMGILTITAEAEVIPGEPEEAS